MKSTIIKARFRDNANLKIGLVTSSTDFSIEKDTHLWKTIKK
jgi:hypothetical protein